jgi:hypothetical protein
MKIATILAVLAASTAGDAPSIQGQYVEARTCDVWTGPCFANGDMNVKGKQALAAWIVEKGAFQGVELSGLKVAAAILAEGTIGHTDEGRIRCAIVVDEKASSVQAKALVALARTLSPKYLADVVAVESRPISFERKGLESRLVVGELASIRTGEFCPCDKICCNEEQFYPAISGSTRVECAKTLEHEYKGKALDGRWSDPNRRSAMVGTFAR